MAWPTPQEYNEAIQNPRTAFADAELKPGQPLLTALGLPRPITGGFASVYQIICPGQRVYAVRCFLREFGDQQDRYAAISDHLERLRLPYMVNFTFLPEGIRVGGRWYPILKMEWVDGEMLHAYIERNLRSPAVLLALAEQWVQMVRSLRQAGIGHGDLQHGNVLVVNGQLRLIDYDGMFVPALAGRASHEIGHRNYQHPGRTETSSTPRSITSPLGSSTRRWWPFRLSPNCGRRIKAATNVSSFAARTSSAPALPRCWESWRLLPTSACAGLPRLSIWPLGDAERIPALDGPRARDRDAGGLGARPRG